MEQDARSEVRRALPMMNWWRDLARETNTDEQLMSGTTPCGAAISGDVSDRYYCNDVTWHCEPDPWS